MSSEELLSLNTRLLVLKFLLSLQWKELSLLRRHAHEQAAAFSALPKKIQVFLNVLHPG